MNFLFLIIAIVALSGCNRNRTETAASLISSENLIASSNQDFILAALSHKLTPNDRHRLQRYYPRTLEKLKNYQNLTPQDVVNMTKAGISDDVIIYEMGATRSSFFLTPEDEVELQQAGVSRKVIRAMKDTIDDRY